MATERHGIIVKDGLSKRQSEIPYFHADSHHMYDRISLPHGGMRK